MNAPKTASITVELTEEQAEGLAQFVKRITWPELRQNSTNDNECDQMLSALWEVKKSLAQAGYQPL